MPAHLSPAAKLFLADESVGPAVFLVSLRRPPTTEDYETLRRTGCTVRGTVGDIVTLECHRDSLQRLAAWSGVRSIELSGPLYPER